MSNQAFAEGLSVRGLTVNYGKRVALHGIDFKIELGEMVVMLGPNGAGKSTALSALAGTLQPTAATITFLGEAVTPDNLQLRRKIGFAGQPPTVYDYLSVREQLQFMCDVRQSGTAQEIDDMLTSLGLGDIKDRLCRELSFGMKQRLSLAMALVGDVKLALLDETLNGLDPLATKQARTTLRDAAKKGVAIVLSTHLLGGIEQISDRAMLLHNGRIVAQVEPAAWQTMCEAGQVEDFYLFSLRADV